MNATLLILLVGDLAAPLQGPLHGALPDAFTDPLPEIALGAEAPPGRNVAWVRVADDGLTVELVLHTARVPGELRRAVPFASTDAVAERARAVAFTLAAMVRERDADLRAMQPPEPERRWVLDGSVPIGFDVPGLHAGAGIAVHLRREVVSWFSVGAGTETGLFAGPGGGVLVQPSLFAETSFAVLRQKEVSLALGLGGGVTAMVLTHGASNQTVWLPMLRANVEARWMLGAHHGLRFALSAHFVSSTVSVEIGGRPAGTLGVVWARPEVGYFVEL